MRKSEKKMVIGVMTSGGDCPGMNAVLNYICKYAQSRYKIVFVRNAYYGLVRNQIVSIDNCLVKMCIHEGGTLLGSKRFPEFEKPEFQKKAVENLRKNKINVLIVVGGNGSYSGAKCLSKLGVNVICIPGTIDNDVKSTDLAIGFATALQTLHNCLLKISSTARSHERVSIVEVMGRYCSDLAFFSSFSTFADMVITHDCFLSPHDVVKNLKKILLKKTSPLIVICEKLYGCDGRPNLQELGSIIEAKVAKKVNICVIGYLQRGGSPCAFDCVLAGMMSFHAIQLINEQKFNRLVGYRNGQITSTKIDDDVEKDKLQNFSDKLINGFIY